MTFVSFVFVLWGRASEAQSQVTGTISNVTRVESWSYFQPRVEVLSPAVEPVGDPNFTFVGDRAELGVRVEGRRFDLGGAFNYVRIENLPTGAVGPGAFGPGAFYFAATGVRYSYQLYLGELTVRVKSADRTRSITIGRMGLGTDSSHPLVRDRIESRLIGNFEHSFYQRRYDGARADLHKGRWRFSAGAFMPTQGGYEESTNLTMTRIRLATASATYATDGAESQAFVHAFRDKRKREMAVADNRGVGDRPPDVAITSFGGSHAQTVKVGGGELDLVAWGVAQLGDWYGLTHRAGSMALEGGRRWTKAPWRPWLRAGYLWASGDGNWLDDRHTTFFPMLPSSRKYALSSVYSQMNVRDVFGQLLFEPGRLKARLEVHRVALASGEDLWYQGSGATSSDDRFFGFAGRYGGGETALGTVVEGTLEAPIRKHWSLNIYGGAMWGGAAVKRAFTSKPLRVWTVENVVRF